MSITDRINLRQDRRQWIKRSAGLVGASVLPLPAVASPAEQEKPEGTMEPVAKPGAGAPKSSGR